MSELTDRQRLNLEFLASKPGGSYEVWADWLPPALEDLVASGFATRGAGPIYTITDAGRAALADAPEPGRGEERDAQDRP